MPRPLPGPFAHTERAGRFNLTGSLFRGSRGCRSAGTVGVKCVSPLPWCLGGRWGAPPARGGSAAGSLRSLLAPPPAWRLTFFEGMNECHNVGCLVLFPRASCLRLGIKLPKPPWPAPVTFNKQLATRCLVPRSEAGVWGGPWLALPPPRLLLRYHRCSGAPAAVTSGVPKASRVHGLSSAGIQVRIPDSKPYFSASQAGCQHIYC